MSDDQPVEMEQPARPAPAREEPPELPPAWDAWVHVLKPLALPEGSEVALFVTHSDSGALKPYVAPYLKALADQGVHILLIAVTDRQLNIRPEVLDLVAGAVVRANIGYDFAAWAHAIRLYPEVYGASTLYLLNDSLIGPATGEAFPRLIERVRASEADLVGLTESHEYRWHVQSYFLALKARLLASGAIQRFFAEVRLLPDKDAVIRAYEIQLAPLVEQSGFRVETLFPSPAALNPTLYGWRKLIADGFPFVKALMLRGVFEDVDTTGWRETLGEAGFDLELIGFTLLAAEQTVPEEPGHGAFAHPIPPEPPEGRPLKLAFIGPWNYDGALGVAARAAIAALRRTGARLNLHPIEAPLERHRPLAPPVDVKEFEGPADVAIIQLNPDGWLALTAAQRRLIGEATRRIGSWACATGPLPRAWWEDFGSVDRIWAPSDACAELFAAQDGAPVDVIPEDSGGPSSPERVGALMVQSLAATLAEPPRPRPVKPVAAVLDEAVPFEEADLGPEILAVPLATDGSPSKAKSEASDAEWIAFAPSGSLAAPDFAAAVRAHAARRPDAAIFYADDLAVETDRPIDQLRLKPEFDHTLLAAQDYVGAPVIVRADALAALGGLRRKAGTAAIADLLFRAHAAGLSIARIAQVLIVHPGARVRATAEDYRLMLESQPSLAGCEVRPGRAPQSFALARRFDALPEVSILIPTMRSEAPEGGAYVERALAGIAEADWPMDRLTVIVGDDIPGEPTWASAAWPFTLRRIETPRGPGEPFNYAAKMNRLWRAAETDQIVFMNDDIRPLGPGWLKALLTFATEEGVGGVGARLLYEDGRLQHAGLAPYVHGPAHLWIGRERVQGTYQDWGLVQREWSMVTGALFATRRSLMERVDGFDEALTLEFNDVDLCLKLRMLGCRIVCTPDAELVHAEKASRGEALPPAEEKARFLARWAGWLKNDPSWHPGLDTHRLDMAPLADAGAWYAPAPTEAELAAASGESPAEAERRLNAARAAENWALGLSLLRAGDLAGAAEAAAEALRLDPSEPNHRNLLGEALELQGRRDEAIETLETGIAAGCENAQTHSLLGNLRQREGELDLAEAAFVRGQQLDPARADFRDCIEGVRRERTERSWLAAQAAEREAQEAERQVQGALQADPPLAERYNVLAEALHRQGRKEEALDALRLALREGSGDVQSFLLLGNWLLRDEAFAEASKWLARGAQAHPDHLEMALLSARAHFAAGKLRQAEAAVASVVAADPDSVEARTLLAEIQVAAEKHADAIATLEQLVGNDPTDARLFALLGDLYRRVGDWPGAERAAREAARLDPLAADNHNLLAEATYNQGRHSEAIDVLRHAADQDGGNAQSFLLLGNWLLRDEAYAEAAKWLAQGARLHPRQGALSLLLAQAHFAAGELGPAAAAAADAVAADPTLIDARNLLAEIMEGQGKRAEAIAALERAADEGLADAQTFSLLGNWLLRDSAHGRAAEWMARAARLHPELAGLSLLLAQAHFALGELDRAEAAAGKAATVDPSLIDARNLLAEIQELRGNRADAIAGLERAAEQGLANAQSFSLLGNFRERDGERAAAEQAYARGVALDPGRADLKLSLKRVRKELAAVS